MKKHKKNSLKIVVVSLIVLFSVLICLLIVYNRYSIVWVEQRNMSISVIDENIIGFNVNSSALYFDKVKIGATGKRIVYVTNNFDFDINVQITTKGNITPMISVSDNDFVLEPGEEVELIYYARPLDVPLGDYEGTTTVIFRRKFI